MAVREYEVLVSAVMVRTGPGKNQVRRILKGGIVKGDHQNSQIRALKAAKAIGKPGTVPSNAMTVARAFHGFDDPVAALLDEALPTPAAVSADPFADLENEDMFTKVNPQVAAASAEALAKS